jgi:hypothetical protein
VAAAVGVAAALTASAQHASAAVGHVRHVGHVYRGRVQRLEPGGNSRVAVGVVRVAGGDLGRIVMK